MKVRIYQSQKKTTQSGRGLIGSWILEYEPELPKVPDPLMGWTTGDTLGQVSLNFASREDAIRFAEKKGYIYSVSGERKRKVIPKNYSDNFKYKDGEV